MLVHANFVVFEGGGVVMVLGYCDCPPVMIVNKKKTLKKRIYYHKVFSTNYIQPQCC